MLMIKTKPGLTVDSSRPSKKRFVAMPAKLLQAGVVRRITPHPKGLSVTTSGWILTKLTYCCRSDKLGYRKALKQVTRWILSYKIPKVEDGSLYNQL